VVLVPNIAAYLAEVNLMASNIDDLNLPKCRGPSMSKRLADPCTGGVGGYNEAFLHLFLQEIGPAKRDVKAAVSHKEAELRS
jgi:hypothetical protein